MDEMKDEKFQTCWEFWSCPKIRRENCLAFKAHEGKDCWRFMTDFAKKFDSRIECRYPVCSECAWFKNNCSAFEFLHAED